MRTVRFHSDAADEFIQAIAWYEQQEPGLGRRFSNAVQASIDLASLFPTVGTPYRGKSRRILLKDFPYFIVYTFIDEVLLIVAVAHFRRKAGYWSKRSLD